MSLRYTLDDDVGLQWAVAQSCARPAGIDEAGRGPLAGPVYAAAVVLAPGTCLAGLDDSKRLTERQRAQLVAHIEAEAVAWAVATASVEEIDTINILEATKLAMLRAVAALAVPADGLLVDGNQRLDSPLLQQTLVKGDSRCAPIAAASVLAKTARDAHMLTLHAQFPQYGFAKHKGYGTADHLAALRRHGASTAHRRTFAPVRAVLDQRPTPHEAAPPRA